MRSPSEEFIVEQAHVLPYADHRTEGYGPAIIHDFFLIPGSRFQPKFDREGRCLR